ncbi:MAG: hypothetical protein AAB631_01900 [Patescibacteria group bacterium]
MENEKNIKKTETIPKPEQPGTQKFGQGVGFTLVIFGMILTLSAVALVVLSLLIKKEVAQADNAKGEFARVLEQFDEIAELNKKRPIANALRGELEKSLPLSIDVPTKIFPLVRALALQYGFPLEISLGVELPGVVPGGGGFEFSAKAEGNITALSNFLIAVEGLETTIQIRQWSFAPSGGNFRMAFSGTIFTRGE